MGLKDRQDGCECDDCGGDGVAHHASSRFLATRSVLLTGEVDKRLCERLVRHMLVLEGESDSEPIRMFIDSPGGDADAGFALFDIIRFLAPPVYTIGMGLVASAAAIVLLAAPRERRFALPNSHYLLHQPLSRMRGVATEIEIHAREIRKMRDRVNQIIAIETGNKIAKVEKDTDRDFWMNAEEAKEYGLVTDVAANRKALRH